MDLVLRNSFRVLDLLVTASGREIAKSVSDLKMFAELCKEKASLFDLIELGDIDRSLDAVKDAARRIELPEMRFFTQSLGFAVVMCTAMSCDHSNLNGMETWGGQKFSQFIYSFERVLLRLSS